MSDKKVKPKKKDKSVFTKKSSAGKGDTPRLGITLDEWEKKYDQEQRLLESICIQHEIDHLNGLTIADRENKPQPIVSEKVGRNEPCSCGSGKKYKKCCINK